MLETEVPYRARIVDLGADLTSLRGTSESSTVLWNRVTIARLALVLAVRRDRPPVLKPTAVRTIDPLDANIEGTSTPANGSPTTLTDADVDRWSEWLDRLTAVDLEHLGVAPTRLIRAVDERQDAGDRLIDAVIVWEALFGGPSEAVLRVCGSLAKLIATAEDRAERLKELKKLYDLRSRIVHGGNPPNGRELRIAADRALNVAIDALTDLIRERADLLGLDSSARSNQLLME